MNGGYNKYTYIQTSPTSTRTIRDDQKIHDVDCDVNGAPQNVPHTKKYTWNKSIFMWQQEFEHWAYEEYTKVHSID